jgi:multidrug efflux system membrane fusion protein
MEASERRSSRQRAIGRTIGVLAVASAAATSIHASRVSFVNPRTDDAAVRANIVGIAPHVSGPIVDLRVSDNQYVKQGDLLFVIDCRPYEARLARTRAELTISAKQVDAQRRALAIAESEIERRKSGLTAATADMARADEERAAAEAVLTRREAEAAYADDYLQRVEPLLERQFVTADKVADARSRRDASAAAVQEARRQLRAARAGVQRGVATREGAARAVDQARFDAARSADLLAQIGDLNARIQAAEATMRAAELDVDYCRVKAPFDAYVTNLNIAVGEYAREGQQLFALVDDRVWYVLADFRETYLPSIKPGMDADVFLVTAPGRRFRGLVQGIGWATSSDSSATQGVLPDVQRTLNWVRLANRFQVRIRLLERDGEHPFRMGTTAVVTVRGFPRGSAAM